MNRIIAPLRRPVVCVTLVLAATLLSGCSAVQGFGEDLSAASVSVQEAFLGSDPDAPPLD